MIGPDCHRAVSVDGERVVPEIPPTTSNRCSQGVEAIAGGGLVGALGYAVLAISAFPSSRDHVDRVLLLVISWSSCLLPPLPVIMVLCAVVGLVYGTHPADL